MIDKYGTEFVELGDDIVNVNYIHVELDPDPKPMKIKTNMAYKPMLDEWHVHLEIPKDHILKIAPLLKDDLNVDLFFNTKKILPKLFK